MVLVPKFLAVGGMFGYVDPAGPFAFCCAGFRLVYSARFHPPCR